MIPAATATFNDSTGFFMGMWSGVGEKSERSSASPGPSAPRRSAVPRFQSHSRKEEPPREFAVTTAIPADLQAVKISFRLSDGTSGRRKVLPADARIVLGP